MHKIHSYFPILIRFNSFLSIKKCASYKPLNCLTGCSLKINGLVQVSVTALDLVSLSLSFLICKMDLSCDCCEGLNKITLVCTSLISDPFCNTMMSYYLTCILHFKDGKQSHWRGRCSPLITLARPVYGGEAAMQRWHCWNLIGRDESSGIPNPAGEQGLGPESKLLTRAITLGHLKSVPLLETAFTSQDDQRIFKCMTPSTPFPASLQPILTMCPAESFQNASAPGRPCVFPPAECNSP